MKGCIVGGVVLALVLAAVVGNAVFVNRTMDGLTAELDALPEVPDPSVTPAEIAVLREKLEAREALLGISVNYTVIDKALESLLSLEAYARAGDTAQYRVTLALVRDQLRDIQRLERIEWANIL